MSSTPFRQDENLKKLITEVSALSGYPQNMIKEIFEYLLIDWAVKLADNPNGFASLEVPYLGTVFAKYKGDEVLEDGRLITNVDGYVKFRDSFTDLVGQIQDEAQTELTDIVERKIKNAILAASV